MSGISLSHRTFTGRTGSNSPSAHSQPVSCRKVRAPSTSIPSTRPASPRFASGTTTVGHPSRLAASTAGSTPRIGRTRPSSANSPSNRLFSNLVGGIALPADSTAVASARSYTDPIFGNVAGDRAKVRRDDGQMNPQLVIAARTRSRDSCSAASGSPTRCTPGSPALISASISTVWPVTALTATEYALPRAISAHPTDVGDRRSRAAQPYFDDIDTHGHPRTVLRRQPDARKPPQPT